MFLPQNTSNQEYIGVVIAIPEPWVSQLTDLRLRLGDLQGSRVPAHITLLPPVPVSPSDRKKIIEHLRAVAQQHSPFKLKLSGADTFRPITQVAYTTVSEGGELCEALAEDIRTGPLDYPLRFPYHPHVTLAQDVSDAAIDLALAIGFHFEASWTVPGFRLDRVSENGMYSSMALFDFENQ